MEACKVELTQGQFALVSVEDLPKISAFKWHARWDIHAKRFYAFRNIRLASGKYTKVSMHRQILECPSGLEVDHINHNTLDNTRENIRIATTSQNQFNRGPRKGNKTGFKGVFFERNRFAAAIKVNRKKINLGRFHTAEAAHAAYCEAARKYHGEFARVA